MSQQAISIAEASIVAAALSDSARLSRNFVGTLAEGRRTMATHKIWRFTLECEFALGSLKIFLDKIGWREPFQVSLFAPVPNLGMITPRLVGVVPFRVFSNTLVDYSEATAEFLAPICDWEEFQLLLPLNTPIFVSSRNILLDISVSKEVRIGPLVVRLFSIVDARMAAYNKSTRP